MNASWKKRKTIHINKDYIYFSPPVIKDEKVKDVYAVEGDSPFNYKQVLKNNLQVKPVIEDDLLIKEKYEALMTYKSPMLKKPEENKLLSSSLSS
jgi:hypothetical protein